MKNKKFWKLKNSVEGSGSRLYIDGVISQDSWWGDEATPQQLRDELKEVKGDTLEVVINSPGGDVWAGVAMHDALKELDVEVTVRVSGLAASIASVIAMAGDKIVMTPGSTMMVHKASMFAWGNSDEMAKAIEMLETVEEGIVSIYSDRSGLPKDEVQALLKAETWMSAEKAVELGFADSVVKPEAVADDEDEPTNIFAGGKVAFSMEATKEAMDSYLNKVKNAEEAELADDAPVVPDVTPTPDKEEEDKEEPTGDEPVVTPPVEDKTTPKAKKKETNPMPPKADDKTTAIAKDQVVTPDNQAPVDAADQKPKIKDYLKSKASMEAFARILEEQAGKTSEDVRMAWKEHLAVTMGVTNPEILLPNALITEIEDAFKAGGEIWNRVTKTGADVFRAAWDTEDDPSSEDGRGRGYNRSREEEKQEQVLTLLDRVLRPQFVYKYITLNKEDVKNQRGTGALVKYVLSELPRRIVRELERAIVIGDGRASDSDFKISSFVAITADAAANNVFAEEYEPEAGESNYESVLRARDQIETEGAVVLISRKGYMTDMYLERNENGGLVFTPGTNLLQVLNLDANLTPDWFEEQDDYEAVLVVLSGYKTVGDESIEAFTNFLLKTNKQEYLQEVWAGGGLTKRKSAVAIVTQNS